jgi:hypothetical protein
MYAGIHAHGIHPHVMTHSSADLHLSLLSAWRDLMHMHTHLYLCICFYTHVCIHTRVYVYIYIYIYMQIYANICFGEYKLAPIHALWELTGVAMWAKKCSTYS